MLGNRANRNLCDRQDAIHWPQLSLQHHNINKIIPKLLHLVLEPPSAMQLASGFAASKSQSVRIGHISSIGFADANLVYCRDPRSADEQRQDESFT